jgi:ABC-2 type transport system ATP-binding protein
MELSAVVRQPLLSLDRVRVVFAQLTAVFDVSFQLEPGHLLGLIGPNGAGKTTLLRAICGLQHANRGQVRVMDQPVAPGADILSRIGFTPDTPALYKELTVRQFLRFIGRGYNLPHAEIDERIDFWLEKVWLKEKADQKVKALSRGMCQRLGIARTLLPNPAVILLDEPAAGLDPAGRVQFRRLLCDLREQGKTLIVSSHILADMAEYCTHIGILSAGEMVRFGTVEEFGANLDAGRCRYQLTLCRSVSALQEDLEQITGVSAVQVDGMKVVLEFQNDPEASAKLLGDLVRRGLPIAAFAPQVMDLEEAYLRTGIRQVE